MMNESHATNDSADGRDAQADRRAAGAGRRHRARWRWAWPRAWRFLFVGAIVFVVGLGMWIAQLLPGRGHVHEPLVEPSLRPQPVTPAPGEVERLRQRHARLSLAAAGEGPPDLRRHQGRPRRRAGDAAAGAALRTASAATASGGRSTCWPAWCCRASASMSVDELEQFHPALLVLGIVIHIVVSLILGLIYGVLMPTLPNIRKPIAWGALLMPLLWTAVSYIALGAMNPGVREGIEWPWFVLSQFIFGLVAAIVFMTARAVAAPSWPGSSAAWSADC